MAKEQWKVLWEVLEETGVVTTRKDLQIVDILLGIQREEQEHDRQNLQFG